MMRKYFFSAVAALSLLALPMVSCQDYLDVVPASDITTIQTTFQKREDALNWMKTCFSMLVYETSHVERCPSYWGADEVVASEYLRNLYAGRSAYQAGLLIGDGLQKAQNPYGGVWEDSLFYGGIRYCNLFLSHIDGVYNMVDAEKRQWKGQVLALKAQYYFELMRRYGAIILVPENIDANATISEMQQPRRPIDQCVEAIVALCDSAYEMLPYLSQLDATFYCYHHKESVATIKAMALLYAASPLFNGNDMMASMVNRDGERIFPAYDREKWRVAAEAADWAIQVCREGGSRHLTSGSSDRPTALLNTMRDLERASYCVDYSNPEALLMIRDQYGDPNNYYHPNMLSGTNSPNYDAYNTGCVGASMKAVEMYYTEHGLPLSEDKQWMASRYQMSKEVDERYKSVVPLNENILSLHRRREPRFYANIIAHNTYWFRNDYYNTPAAILCECMQGQEMGTGSKTYDSRLKQNLSGYYIKKFDYTDGRLRGYYMNVSSGLELATMVFRLPDLYLASAEAWNEYLDAPDDRVYEPLNLVRERAGLNDVVSSWGSYARNPQNVRTRSGMREIIHSEWNIEFMFEGRRFWNLRRWMVAHEELNTPLYGWNVLGSTEDKFYNNYDSPIIVWKKRGFTAPRDYFFPLNAEEILISGVKQNPGW